MQEALKELARIEGLLPRDMVFARALIRNGFVEARAVLDEAGKLASCDASEYGGGILARLTAKGLLTEKLAGRIEAALKAKSAGQKGAPTAGPANTAGSREEQVEAGRAENVEPTGDGPSARPEEGQRDEPHEKLLEEAPEPLPDEKAEGASRPDRMWKPRAKPVARDEPGADQICPRDREHAREEAEAFFQKCIKSKLHAALLDGLARKKAAVVDPKEAAGEHGVGVKAIKQILDEWRHAGLVRTVGSYPYYYDPHGKDKEQVEAFLEGWRDPAQHQEIMQRLLELEGK